jgi:hypothetical protein
LLRLQPPQRLVLALGVHNLDSFHGD